MANMSASAVGQQIGQQLFDANSDFFLQQRLATSVEKLEKELRNNLSMLIDCGAEMSQLDDGFIHIVADVANRMLVSLIMKGLDQENASTRVFQESTSNQRSGVKKQSLAHSPVYEDPEPEYEVRRKPSFGYMKKGRGPVGHTVALASTYIFIAATAVATTLLTNRTFEVGGYDGAASGWFILIGVFFLFFTILEIGTRVVKMTGVHVTRTFEVGCVILSIALALWGTFRLHVVIPGQFVLFLVCWLAITLITIVLMIVHRYK